MQQKLAGTANVISEDMSPSPSSHALSVANQLLMALQAADQEAEEYHLGMVHDILNELNPVQRRNVQQMLESLGGKLWNEKKLSLVPHKFPAVKIECDRFGDMQTIICRLPGPQSRRIELHLGRPNTALEEGLSLFRLESGEPVIIKFSADPDCQVIQEIMVPFGCNAGLKS